MAGRHVETFIAAAEAVGRGDVDAVLSVAHPECEMYTLRSAVQGPYRGHDGVRAFMRDSTESFEVFEPAYDQVEELPDGRVLAIGSARVRGKGGGVELNAPTAVVAEFRDGLIWRFRDHGDAGAARAAVG